MRKDLSEPERRKSLAEEFILDIKHIKMQLIESENIIRINNFLILIEEKFNNYIKECDADHENQETQSQQPLKNSKEFNTSYGEGKTLKKSAITNGEMESSPAPSKRLSPVDATHDVKLGKGESK